MKFKVGQKVRMVIGYGDARKGAIGIVRGVPETFHQYAVEFPCFNKYNCGHNCGGLVPSKNGYWVEEDYMELASEQEEHIMTLEEKITKFMDGIIVLHTPTQELWDKLMQKLEKLGVTWYGGTEPTKGGSWLNHRELTCVNIKANYMLYGRCYDYNGRTIIDVTEGDFIIEPSSVTIISPSGEEKHIRAVVTKKDNDYVIKETRNPKFSIGESFVSKEGILGKVLDFSNKGEYYYRWIISENYYSLPLEQFEGIMSKIEW